MSLDARKYIRIRRVHFIGIGGEGMSGIAEVLLTLGYKVSGSDLRETGTTRRLAGMGAQVFYGHRPENIGDAEVVVVSSAIREDNVEVQESRRRNIPVIRRALMLAELMRMKYGIAVTGSHGKTTVTSMIGHVLESARLDPTIIVGGKIKTAGGNSRWGRGDILVAEADESDGSFLYLYPFMAVITNLDREHLNHYGSVEGIKKAFVEFARRVPFYSSIFLCADDPHLRAIMPQIDRRIVTYGLTGNADLRAAEISFDRFCSRCRVYRNGRELGPLKLNVPGLHNVTNALAAIAVGLELGVAPEILLSALESYTGIGRRFELKAEVGDIMVIEDYGHHPTEIMATLRAAKEGWGRRIVTVFQPHRYTRLLSLMEEFAACFADADVLILTEVYPASEPPIEGVDGQRLFRKIAAKGGPRAFYEPDLQAIPELAAALVRPGDMVFILGAGNINQVTGPLVAALRAKK